MKTYLYVLFAGLLIVAGCKKDANTNQLNPNTDSVKNTLSLTQAKTYFDQQTAMTNSTLQTASINHSFNLNKLAADWNKASEVKAHHRNWWTIALPGQPTYKGAKQGYRKLVVTRDSTGQVTARILEFIPDAAYLHIHHGADTKTFTGLVFVYDQHYNLQKGMVYNNGKQVGRIKAGKVTVNAVPSLQTNNTRLRVDMVAISASCDWVEDNYIDSEGVVTIYGYNECTYDIYDDGMDGGGGGGGGGGDASGDPYGGGGGGGGSEDSAPTMTADLPGQTNPAIDPKAFINCFGSLPDAGAKETITVYVQEPQPGLPFNYGINSVGHTAISLSKTNNGQTITQTVGFYPTVSKLAPVGTSSKIADNGGLDYTVSITYNVLPFEFNAIANYIANPPSTYSLYTNNCTNFVYNACQQGNITLPDPTGNVGMFQTGMTPAALGASISNVAGIMNVNTNGGTVGQSHGPCN